MTEEVTVTQEAQNAVQQLFDDKAFATRTFIDGEQYLLQAVRYADVLQAFARFEQSLSTRPSGNAGDDVVEAGKNIAWELERLRDIVRGESPRLLYDCAAGTDPETDGQEALDNWHAALSAQGNTGDDAGKDAEPVEAVSLLELIGKMRKALTAHPFYFKLEGTPAHNDLPVIAAEIARSVIGENR